MLNKYKRKRLIKYAVSAAVALFIAALAVILNAFVPLVYFTAYINFKKDIPPAGAMRVSYLDVGYGDCAIVELPDGKTMLIDGGNGDYAHNYAVLKALNRRRINTIDYLVCTSVLGEHCGGLAEVLKYKRVSTAYIPYALNVGITGEYSNFFNGLLASGANIITAQYGEGIYNGPADYFFCFLSPSVVSSGNSEYADMNSFPSPESIKKASAVMWLEYAGNGFLFLSDADGVTQRKIADGVFAEGMGAVVQGQAVSLSPCAVLKAGDHCNQTSTSEFLFDAFGCKAAVVSTGVNANGSPDLTAFANLQLYFKDNIYRTDICGTVTAVATSSGTEIYKEK